MLKYGRSLALFFALSALTQTHQAHGEVISAIMGAASVIKTGIELAGAAGAGDELGGSFSALEELYQEIGGEEQASEESKRTVELINEIKSVALELGATEDEMNQISYGRQVNGVQASAQALTKVIRGGKRVHRVIKTLSDKSQMAQLEAVELQKQSLALQQQMLQLQIQEQLKDQLSELKKEKELRLTIKELSKFIDKNGGNKNKGNPYSFPIVSEKIKKFIDISKKFVPLLMVLLIPIFNLRTLNNYFHLSSPGKYDRQIEDFIVCCFWLLSFPFLVSFSIECAEALSQAVAGLSSQSLIAPKSAGSMPETASILSLSKWVDYLFTGLSFILFWLAKQLRDIFLGMCILLFPFLIVKGKMIGVSGLEKFFSFFLNLCLWPVYWEMCGTTARLLFSSDQLISGTSGIALIFSILQFVAPEIVSRLTTGSSVFSSVTSSIRNSLSSVSSQTSSFAKGVAGRHAPADAKLGSLLGQSAHLLGTQVAQRTRAGMGRAYDSWKGNVSHGSGSNEPRPSTSMHLRQGASGFLTNKREIPVSSSTQKISPTVKDRVGNLMRRNKPSNE